jgi:alpha-galactosidase
MNDERSLASTPPMGWNSWNMLGSAVDEESIRRTADAIVRVGFKEIGYEYVVIDDCWSVKGRRDSDGNLIANPEKFPNGMKALADYVHDKGLKIGIYSDAAESTCAGYPGSYGFEEQDAALWASWGFDFLKYDYCNAPWEQEAAIDRYGRMGEALRNTGREFLFSLCEWGGRSPHLWGRNVGGHMWRVSGDVFDSWVNVAVDGGRWTAIGVDVSIDIAESLSDYGGPKAWNDLDMLVVGLKGKGHVTGGGMSYNEYQTHMSLWCIACSPLMIGCDITKIDNETADLLLNPEVIAVNQDPLGRPARRVRTIGHCEIWRKPLADGSTVVALINRGSSGTDVKLRACDAGLLDTAKLARNLWTRTDIADFMDEMTVRVEPHQTVLLKVTHS